MWKQGTCLLSESNIVFLCVTENKDSYKMINREALPLKDNALFLNVSWTNTIDWEWIYDTFTSTNIKIWTDILDDEQQFNRYIKNDRFYATSHIWFNTVEAKERNIENLMKNLDKSLHFTVDEILS